MSFFSALALSVSSLVQSPPAPNPPPPTVARLGSRDAFGPGIMAVQHDAIQVELKDAGHIIVVRVDADGSIQPVFPTPDDTSNALPAGRHVVAILGLQPELSTPATAAPALEPVIRTADQIARQGRQARPSATGDDPVRPVEPVAHWLLIVSDIPTSATEVESLLGAMTHDFPSMKAELETVAKALMHRRTRRWTGFYTPVR
jgi:hypothetical protein